MVVSLHSRQRYRNALGADPRRSLVVVTSTWSTNSLLGSWPNLLRRLLAELPVDRFQVAAIMHPNIWQGHGSAQVKLWLADCLRAGLTVIPPLEGWRAALIAADLVVGDFGAVSCYGAAVGRPVLLAVFPEDQIVPGTAVHRLGQIAPRLDHTSSLRAQVEAAIQTHDNMRYAEIAELVTSVPGESARLLRTACYRLMGLAEPATEAIVAELPTDGLIPRAGPRVAAAHVTGEIDAARRVVRVERFPADVSPRFGGPPLDRPRHLVVHSGHPVRGLRDAADVLFTEEEPAQVPPGRVLAFVHRGGCRIRDVSGSVVDMTLPDGSPVDPVVLASVAYCWAAEGQEPRALAPTITVEVGGQRHQVSVRVD